MSVFYPRLIKITDFASSSSSASVFVLVAMTEVCRSDLVRDQVLLS